MIWRRSWASARKTLYAHFPGKFDLLEAVLADKFASVESVFFSGFIFLRETMPWIFYALGTLFPTTYFIALMRAIILRGANLFE